MSLFYYDSQEKNLLTRVMEKLKAFYVHTQLWDSTLYKGNVTSGLGPPREHLWGAPFRI